MTEENSRAPHTNSGTLKMTVREQFEAWISGQGKTLLHVTRYPNGDYIIIAVLLAWEAWNAALEARG